MIRVVVTVLLAIAILAASMPAVEHAAADRSEQQLRSGVHDLDAAATALAESEEAVPGTVGARRTIELRIPTEDVGAAGVERLAISGSDRRYEFRLEGRDEAAIFGTVPVHTLDGEPLVLHEPGTHELVLALVEIGGDRRVVIARLDRVQDGALGGSGGAEVQDP